MGIIRENGLIIFLKEDTINKVYLKNTHYYIYICMPLRKFADGIIDGETEGVVPQLSQWFLLRYLCAPLR